MTELFLRIKSKEFGVKLILKTTVL